MAETPADERPFVVGIGGTTRPGSSTEQALALALSAAAAAGARTALFGAPALTALPHYGSDLAPGAPGMNLGAQGAPGAERPDIDLGAQGAPGMDLGAQGAPGAERPDIDLGAQGAPMARALVAAVRQADGVILASPGYHGSISGLVKNAIDYIEETAKDARVYLDGVPVGLIATAYGWQATGSTLAALRAIVHALRGWPTPLGAAINSAGGIFKDGTCTDPAAARQLALVGRQVVEFAQLRRLKSTLTQTGPV